MLERSRRRRLLVAPVALLALAAAVGGSASASRPRPPAEDAFARAVALQVNAGAAVVAEARGNDTRSASGTSLHVPGLLELDTAHAAAETRLGSELRAHATTHLGHLRLKASAARVDELTGRVLSRAGAAVEKALLATCALGTGVAVEAVVAAAVQGVALGAAGSLDAEIRAEVRAVLETEDLSRPWCRGPIERLTGRVVAAIERPLRTALEARLSVSLTALRTRCDLDRQAGTAHTELLVHAESASLLGVNGEARSDGGLVRVAPNTGLDLGGGISLVLNQQHRTDGPGRETRITVHGAVLQVGGIVVATVASSHCRLSGDVAPDAGGGATTEPESRLASFAAGAYLRVTRHH